jgi:hypothetical protein
MPFKAGALHPLGRSWWPAPSGLSSPVPRLPPLPHRCAAVAVPRLGVQLVKPVPGSLQCARSRPDARLNRPALGRRGRQGPALHQPQAALLELVDRRRQRHQRL